MSLSHLLLTLSFVIGACLQAAATPLVEEIRFVNDSGETIQVESEPLKTQVGMPFHTQSIIDDINHLKETLPQFQNITMSVNPIDDRGEALEIIIQFQLKRIVKSLRLLALDGSEIPMDLRKTLKTQRNSEFNAADLLKDKQTIRDLYVKKGYPETKVEHEAIIGRNGHDIDLTFRIETITNRLVVRKLKFHGNEGLKKSKLKKLMKMKPRGFFLARHTVFSLYQLDEDANNLEQYYQENGFLDAKVSFEYSYSLEGMTTIKININEGKSYKVQRVVYQHGNLYPQEEFSQFYKSPKKKGYSAKAIRATLQDLRHYFGNKGHAQVQALSYYDSQNETLFIKIIEGEIFEIEEITIEGLQRVKQKHLLLDVEFKERETFNSGHVEKTLKNLRESGLYQDVRIDFKATSATSGNMIIVVQEARTRTISFGAGTGTNGILGELSFNDRNFLNTGNSVSLQLQKMAEMTKIGLIYQDPHLFDSDVSMTLAARYRDFEGDNFDEREMGVTLMVEKKIKENLTLGLGTRLEFLNLSDIDQEIRLADHNADGEDRIIGMVGTLFYKKETRDSAGDIKDGIKVHMALLPSFADQGAYLKTFATVMGSQSLYENDLGVSHTLSGRLTVGYASENAPFHEKFYAGGAGTLRGYARNSIKTEEGDGGQVLLSGSLGYSFPLWQEKVKGVLFLEAASVGDSFDSLDNIRAVGGIGVKANLMDTFLGSMIEAGIAIPLRKQDDDILKPFYFIFGDYDPAYDL